MNTNSNRIANDWFTTFGQCSNIHGRFFFSYEFLLLVTQTSTNERASFADHEKNITLCWHIFMRSFVLIII